MAQGRKAVKYGRIGLKLIVFLMALWISGRGSTITAGAFYEKENFENNKETSEEMEIGQAAHDMGISEELEQLQKYLDRSLGGKKRNSGSFIYGSDEGFCVRESGSAGNSHKRGIRTAFISQVREGAGLLTQAAAIGLLGAMFFRGRLRVFKNGSDLRYRILCGIPFAVCLSGRQFSDKSFHCGRGFWTGFWSLWCADTGLLYGSVIFRGEHNGNLYV